MRQIISGCILAFLGVMTAGCSGQPGSLGEYLSGTAEPAAAPAARPAERPALGLTRNERLQTAKFVEGLPAYRTNHDNGAPILRNARISGPLDRAAPGQSARTYYCVSAEIGSPSTSILPIGGSTTQLTSLELVRTRSGRKKGFRADALVNQATPPECRGAFEPFPELEQVRNERRAALGMPAPRP